MSPTWRIDFLHLGAWDWAPGFEMFWMEAGAPDGPLALVSLLLHDGTSTVLVNTGPDVAMLPVYNERWAEFDAETLAAYERIRREADVLIPLSDPAVFEQHPDGIDAAPCAAKSPPRREPPP